MNPWFIGLVGLATGVIGTGLGGVVFALTGRPSSRVLGGYLGFAGGIMLALAFVELMPEAIEEGSMALAIIGFVIGVGLLIVMDRSFPHMHHGGGEEGDTKLKKMGYLVAFGIAIHNFPEGVALGAGWVASPTLGLGLAIVLALHNVPEGLAMAAPLAAGGMSIKRVVWLTVLAGLPVGVGALIGGLIGDASPVFLSLSLGFAAGAMMYISFDELLPEAHSHSEGSHHGIYGGVLGVLIGYIVIALV